MDDAGLFFPLSESIFIVKLSESKKQIDKNIIDKRVFTLNSLERNGNTLKLKSASVTTIQTNDLLGSKDLLTLQWYMHLAGIYTIKKWELNDLHYYKKIKKGRNTCVCANNDEYSDIENKELTFMCHNRVLEIVNDIQILLGIDKSTRLPKGGAPGLVFFLCKSRAQLPSGAIRKWCNFVIHHFDPIEEDNDNNKNTHTITTIVNEDNITKQFKNLKVTEEKQKKEKEIKKKSLAKPSSDSKTIKSSKSRLSPEISLYISKNRDPFTKDIIIFELRKYNVNIELIIMKQRYAFVSLLNSNQVSIILKHKNSFPFFVSPYKKEK